MASYGRHDLFVEFLSLQYALYMSCFVCVLGGAFFLATALFIQRDREQTEKLIKGTLLIDSRDHFCTLIGILHLKPPVTSLDSCLETNSLNAGYIWYSVLQSHPNLEQLWRSRAVTVKPILVVALVVVVVFLMSFQPVVETVGSCASVHE